MNELSSESEKNNCKSISCDVIEHKHNIRITSAIIDVKTERISLTQGAVYVLMGPEMEPNHILSHALSHSRWSSSEMERLLSKSKHLIRNQVLLKEMILFKYFLEREETHTHNTHSCWKLRTEIGLYKTRNVTFITLLSSECDHV